MESPSNIQLALPKGRMFDRLAELFRAAGCPLTLDERSYRASLELDGFSTKLLKPQSIVEMLGAGRRDIGSREPIGSLNWTPTWCSCSTPN